MDNFAGEDGVTSEIRRRLQDAEREMRLVALELESNKSTETLVAQDCWKLLVASLERIVDHENERMLTEPLTEHELGWRQGFIRALRCIIKKQPFSPEEVARRQAKMQNLANAIADNRKLLD